jgi:hypothetical protein
VVAEILYVENLRRGLALKLPFIAIGVEDSMTEQSIHAIPELGTLLIVVKIGYENMLAENR